jgi:Phage capsid family
MPTATEKLAGEIRQKREKLQTFYAKKGPDGTIDVDATGRDEMKSLNDELTVLCPKWEKLREDEKAEAENKKSLDLMKEVVLPPGFHGDGTGRLVGTDGHYLDRRGQAVKGLGDLFTESTSYKTWADGRKAGSAEPPRFSANAPEANIKTLFATTAGWDPFVNRLPGAVLSPQQMPKVVDLIPMGNTGEHSVKWMLETTYVNAAAEVAEAGAYAESQFALTEQITPVNKIGVTLPMTDEQLADVPGSRDYLNGRLELGLKQRLDLQLLVGNGTAPNLKGLYNISGIQSQSLGADPVPDAFYKAMVLVQTVGFADPSGIIMHPQNWQDVRLLRTSQGLYIWGNPDQVGPQRMWGVPVVTTTYCTFGTGLVADFVMYTQLYYRKGIDFLITNSHASEFTSGIQRVRADMRVAFVVFRPLAICQVTGMRSS